MLNNLFFLWLRLLKGHTNGDKCIDQGQWRFSWIKVSGKGRRELQQEDNNEGSVIKASANIHSLAFYSKEAKTLC